MNQRTPSPVPLLTLAWSAAAAILLLTSGCHGCSSLKQPHIIFILADDLGWRDVSWNANDTYTPHLEQLRSDGVALDSHYMQPACTASRVALYTGYYPYTMGFQRNEYSQFHRYRNLSLSTEIRILPEYLNQAGYANHLVGKWQMGFCNWRYTPTRRGFETFYGSYGGNSGHFNHTPRVGGYDFRDDLNVDWSAKGQYSTHLYTQRAVDIITQHHDSEDTRPLFLLLSYEAPHVPVEAPQEYIDKYCDHVENRDDNDRRRERCGMMAALDEGVRNVTDVLDKLGYLKDTLIVFTSDNGAPGQQGGSNWPLRGKKRSAYEGGVRVPSFLYSHKRSRLLPKQPYAYKGVMHVTDWLPTLLTVAGMDPDNRLPKNIDGVDQWSSIRRNWDSPRKFMVYDLDSEENYAAVRKGKWKLIQDNSGEKCNGWFNPPPEEEESRPRKLSCPQFQLFNLEDDPWERFDVADLNQRIVRKLQKFLQKSLERKGDLPPSYNTTESYPDQWDGVWSPGWCDTAH